jgi:stearoyl-CoA desaturase (delta-9 desaturase)
VSTETETRLGVYYRKEPHRITMTANVDSGSKDTKTGKQPETVSVDDAGSVLAALKPRPRSATDSLERDGVEFDHSRGLTYEKTRTSKWMSEKELNELPLLQRINWLSTSIIFTPLIGTLIGVCFVRLRWQTLVLAIVTYFCFGLGITGGYHRLWSHRSYDAHWLVQTILACFGAAAFEGSARYWCRLHRAHHRYVDSDRDPYAVEKGFWYAHMWWMVFKLPRQRQGRVDITDLNANPILRFQHRYYLPIAILFSFVIPLTISTLGWGDFWGGLVYACFGRMLFVQQSTFCVNSLAHWWGEQTFSRRHTSYDSVVTALVTLGEGYHNFHHEFPHDYRNGVVWYHWDPTKWVIRLLSWAGLAWHLIRFPRNELVKARLQVRQEKLDEAKRRVDWGKPIESLPFWTWKEVRSKAEEDERLLIVIDGIVHDCTRFKVQHPGGQRIIEFWNARDATQAFNGDVYNHTKAARNLLAHLRVARLREIYEPECEENDANDVQKTS